MGKSRAERAVRLTVTGEVQDVGLRDMTVERAGDLGVLGWVRHGPDDDVLVHVEGDDAAVEGLVEFLAGHGDVEVDEAKVEGHEQFAIRGVSAGRFEIREGAGRGGYILRLEVDGSMRSWAVPKEPSMDPADKRMAIELGEGVGGDEGVIWDEGTYEQGGRVAWPEALERGHAVFVLHGERLEGGFALQRTRRGDKPQWLLIKRADEHARRSP
jgi:acylphosphatase